MDLQQTISKMFGQEVTLQEAKELANTQFGLLCAYIKEQHTQEIIKTINTNYPISETLK